MKFFVFLLVLPLVFGSEMIDSGGGVPFLLRQPMPCLTQDQRDAVQRDLRAQEARLFALGLLRESGERPELLWPIRQNPDFSDAAVDGVSNFVDHDTGFPDSLLDYTGGGRTYDTADGYNHQGLDIFNWPFGWEMMARDQVWVVAAAPGTIIGKDDGNFDRNCSFNPENPNWNAVYVRHADGSTAWYGHLKAFSLTSKQIGETVIAGEYLGVVGSSGISTGPHLHFELYDANKNLQDPFNGPSNTMNDFGWWQNQRDYYVSVLNALMTHDGAPEFSGNCPGEYQVNAQNQFAPGSQLTVAAYYQDQLPGWATFFQILRPDESIWTFWNHTGGQFPLTASFWYWTFELPTDAMEGTWVFLAEYRGQTVRHHFEVLPCDASFMPQLPQWPEVDVLGLIGILNCNGS